MDWRSIPLYRVDGHLAHADAGQDLTFLMNRLLPVLEHVTGELKITVMAQAFRALAWECRKINSSLTKLAEVAISIAQEEREARVTGTTTLRAEEPQASPEG